MYFEKSIIKDRKRQVTSKFIFVSFCGIICYITAIYYVESIFQGSRKLSLLHALAFSIRLPDVDIIFSSSVMVEISGRSKARSMNCCCCC